MAFIKTGRKQLLRGRATRLVFAAALPAGLSLAVTACGGGGATPPSASSAPPSSAAAAASTSASPATTAPAAAATSPAAATATPAAATADAAASPTGTWNAAYATAPTSILGQYSITAGAGGYVMTTATTLHDPNQGCSLPAGEEVATFSASGAAGTYSGAERTYLQGTCAFSGTDATLTVMVSGSAMLLLVSGQQTVELTPAATTTTASGAASPSALTASSAAGCTVPNEIGAGLSGHTPAATAEQYVAHGCAPLGYHVVTVLTVSGPAGTAPGELWKESPAPGTSAPDGSTVTLYFQP
jgi:hypothetical protein